MGLDALKIEPVAAAPQRRPFLAALADAQACIGALDAAVFDTARDAGTPDLNDAMQYAVQGGKALRAFLVIESGRLHGVATDRTGLAALAIEYIHAYSLIHDDLPCMDDDDLRRGKPTVHRKWNEHTAVLAGDALQALAFEVLAHPSVGDDRTRVRLMGTLAAAAGRGGMVGGQMMDIAAETSSLPFSLDQIIAVQTGKTGALINWAARAGAVMADAPTKPLDAYGAALGLAFQIWDDVLDIEGDVAKTGKAVGKDTAAGKATFVSHLGLDGAKSRAQELVDQACDALSGYGEDAECLREAARFVISRET